MIFVERTDKAFSKEAGEESFFCNQQTPSVHVLAWKRPGKIAENLPSMARSTPSCRRLPLSRETALFVGKEICLLYVEFHRAVQVKEA